MEKFAGYGFNKSHSAAYAVLSYQTAYLKAHYPAAFMAAVMSADLDNTDRLVTLKDDCRKLGLDLQAPSVNRSSYHFSVAGDRAILYGLGAIKGVGRAAVEALIAEREAHGAYTGLAEFCRRVDHDKVNRRALEASGRYAMSSGRLWPTVHFTARDWTSPISATLWKSWFPMRVVMPEESV